MTDIVSIAEAVAGVVEDLLAEISVENDYPIDVTVIRPSRPVPRSAENGSVVIPRNTADKTVLLMQRSRRRGDPDSGEGAATFAVWVQEFEVLGIRRLPETDDTPSDAAANEIGACIEKAIMTNPQMTGSAFDPGRVTDTLVTSIEPIDPTDAAYCGARVMIEVHYQHPFAETFAALS